MTKASQKILIFWIQKFGCMRQGDCERKRSDILLRKTSSSPLNVQISLFRLIYNKQENSKTRFSGHFNCTITSVLKSSAKQPLTQRRSGTSQHILTCQWRSKLRITHQKSWKTFGKISEDMVDTFGISTPAVNRKFVRKNRIETTICPSDSNSKSWSVNHAFLGLAILLPFCGGFMLRTSNTLMCVKHDISRGFCSFNQTRFFFKISTFYNNVKSNK